MLGNSASVTLACLGQPSMSYTNRYVSSLCLRVCSFESQLGQEASYGVCRHLVHLPCLHMLLQFCCEVSSCIMHEFISFVYICLHSTPWGQLTYYLLTPPREMKLYILYIFRLSVPGRMHTQHTLLKFAYMTVVSL